MGSIILYWGITILATLAGLINTYLLIRTFYIAKKFREVVFQTEAFSRQIDFMAKLNYEVFESPTGRLELAEFEKDFRMFISYYFQVFYVRAANGLVGKVELDSADLIWSWLERCFSDTMRVPVRWEVGRNEIKMFFSRFPRTVSFWKDTLSAYYDDPTDPLSPVNLYRTEIDGIINELEE